MTDRDQRFAENSEAEEKAPVPNLRPAASELPQRIQPFKKNADTKLHLLSTFCENPINVTFETQEEDEKVLLFVRQSQWVNLPWLAATAIFIVLPILAFFLRGIFAQLAPSTRFLLIFIPVYYLFVVIYAFVNFVTWYFNVVLVTTKRIIDVDFHQVVLKDVAETKLSLVQDVSYRQDGVLPNLFGFGFIMVQTAGTLENFEFEDLPQPERFVEIVDNLIGGRNFFEH